MTGAFTLPCRGLGGFQPPAWETVPEAVTTNVAIARARTGARALRKECPDI